MTIYTTLRTAPKTVLTRLRSKLPHDGDKACADLADLLTKALDNECSCIIRPDTPGFPHLVYRFGVDEPWPEECLPPQDWRPAEPDPIGEDDIPW